MISVGSINLDFQARADSWPGESETRLAHDFLCAGGGKGANVAALVAKLELPAVLMGRVGDDVFAELALAPLGPLGVDLQDVKRAPGQSTGVSMIVVRDDGDKTIVLAANANQQWEREAADAVRQRIERCEPGSVVCVDLEIPHAIALAALRAARARGLCSVLDPSPADRVDDAVIALSDYVVPNPREAQTLTGIEVRSSEHAHAAGKRLIERGARHACIKLPDGGAALVTQHGNELIKPPKVKVVDKTGAGDAFAAGLCAALCEGRSGRDAVRQAVAASSFSVTRYGSRAAYPDRAQLAALLSEAPA